MTPKQQYEARKAEREKLRDMDQIIREKSETLAMIDLMDRFVTAVERIADAMAPQARQSNMVFDPNSASGFRVVPPTS